MFEENLKLSQTIKESLYDDFALLTDLQLKNVTASNNIILIDDTCPKCGSKDGFIHYYDKETQKDKIICYNCNYSEEIDI